MVSRLLAATCDSIAISSAAEALSRAVSASPGFALGHLALGLILAELGDRILDGEITVGPYRIGQTSPCANCQYQSICRFDVKFNTYQILAPMKREDVLKRVMEENP